MGTWTVVKEWRVGDGDRGDGRAIAGGRPGQGWWSRSSVRETGEVTMAEEQWAGEILDSDGVRGAVSGTQGRGQGRWSRGAVSGTHGRGQGRGSRDIGRGTGTRTMVQEQWAGHKDRDGDHGTAGGRRGWLVHFKYGFGTFQIYVFKYTKWSFSKMSFSKIPVLQAKTGVISKMPVFERDF